MIKRKKKPCADCGELRFIWAYGKCEFCARRAQKTLPKTSARQKEILDEYKVIRREFLASHRFCKVRLPKVCTKQATQIHHKAGKATRKLYLDTGNFLPICGPCHQYVEEHPTEAKEKGWSADRLNK